MTLNSHLHCFNKGVKVTPRSKIQIDGLAKAFRKLNQKDIHQSCDVLHILEFGLAEWTDYKFLFEPKNKLEMGDVEAAVSPDKMLMHIREDVYENLCVNDPRARFTVAHEFGHLILHDGTTLNRGSGTHKIYEDSEWQANRFAAELLAPLEGCKGLGIEEIMQKYGVSYQCAFLRYRELKN